MALVERDGPFSMFPGIDRTLTILDGAGMDLVFDAAQGSHRLTTESPPFAFSAELSVEARLVASTVTDLNVMTRRQHHRHRVSRLAFQGRRVFATAAAEIAVFCIGPNPLTVTTGNGPAQELQSRDCAILRTAPDSLVLMASGPAQVLVVEFYRTAATAE